jgi:predicted RNase H-like nuclease (RuvC/YqgF family)
LSGFVPTALYDEMKRERDELFFRLARLESERSQVQQVRRALDIMEAEIRRLEAEIRRRQAAVAPAAGLEELRRAYRRWLDLRRRRALRFGDFLAVRRTDPDP